MQFSPLSCHFISLWMKNSPQHPVHKHPQSMWLVIFQKKNLVWSFCWSWILYCLLGFFCYHLWFRL
jgi:hypothetical protein